MVRCRGTTCCCICSRWASVARRVSWAGTGRTGRFWSMYRVSWGIRPAPIRRPSYGRSVRSSRISLARSRTTRLRPTPSGPGSSRRTVRISSAITNAAPWNQARSPRGWVLIDWDTVAPGSRLWELAYAAQTMVGLRPDRPTGLAAELLVALVDGYGLDDADRSALATSTTGPTPWRDDRGRRVGRAAEKPGRSALFLEPEDAVTVRVVGQRRFRCRCPLRP